VTSIKSDLSGLGDGVEEFRAVCRQLQSLMRKIPDCVDAPFESEADTLMDRWLDVGALNNIQLISVQICSVSFTIHIVSKQLHRKCACLHC